jgi:parallel beta-helix repeat protein
MVTSGVEARSTQAVSVSIQTPFGRKGGDFLIAQNTIDGPFGDSGICVKALNRVRIVHNHITNGAQFGIKIGDGGGQGVDTAIVEGNVISGCAYGISIEESVNVDVLGNSLSTLSKVGLRMKASNGMTVAARVLWNAISKSEGAAISEEGTGIFDTHYLFNDLRNNAAGAYLDVNSSATRLGNLGTEEYILRHISGTKSWNPPPIENGSSTSTTVSLDGARVGDTVAVGFSQPVLAGAILAGAITADNMATVTLLNMTGLLLDLLEGTVRVDVWRH